MIFYSPYIGTEMLRSYKWIGYGLGLGWDLCGGLFYEHRFAVLITFSGLIYLSDSDICKIYIVYLLSLTKFVNVSETLRRILNWNIIN